MEARRVLFSENEIPTHSYFKLGCVKIRRNISRKSLQVLQPSANDPNVLVSSPGMVRKNGKKADDPLKTNAIFEDKNCVGKENASVMRRSKRKNADLTEGCQRTVSTNMPFSNALKSCKPKSSRTILKTKKKPEIDSVDSNQSEQDFVFADSKSKKPTTENGSMESEYSTPPVSRSFSEQHAFITSGIPVDTYWRDLAEERRVSLELALRENAECIDELEVLETENSQLKSLLKEIETFMETVKDILV